MTTNVNRDELLQRAKKLIEQDIDENKSNPIKNDGILSKDQIDSDLSLKEYGMSNKIQRGQ